MDMPHGRHRENFANGIVRLTGDAERKQAGYSEDRAVTGSPKQKTKTAYRTKPSGEGKAG